MLVNARKLLIIPLFFIGWHTVQAQEVWTLKQCIDSAILHNKTLKVNQNNINISTYKEKEAKANLLPKIAANVDYNYFIELPTQLMPMNVFNPQVPEGQFRNIQFGVPHNINANVRLTMPLYNPQVYGAIENAKIANELSQLQFQKSEEQVLYDITTLYYNAQILKNQLYFLDSNWINTQKLLKNMQLLKEQLLAKGTDVSKIQLQADQLSTQKENVSNKYSSILNMLKLNIGIPMEQDVDVIAELEEQQLNHYTRENTVDFEIAKAYNKLLNNELTVLNRSKTLPTINLVASYGTTGFGYDKAPDNFLKFYPIGFVGLQLNYPIFNGTVTLQKINQKKLEISNNELQAQLIDDKNRVEIENSERQKTMAQQTIINTKNQINLAQSIYEQSILQQKQGVATLTDILLADNALREAQQNYLLAIMDYLKADLEIKKLKGIIKN